jgi:hypothetical protein
MNKIFAVAPRLFEAHIITTKILSLTESVDTGTAFKPHIMIKKLHTPIWHSNCCIFLKKFVTLKTPDIL